MRSQPIQRRSSTLTWWVCGLAGAVLVAMFVLAWIGSLPPEQREVLPAAAGGAGTLILGAFGLFAAVFAYLLPIKVARDRNHRNLAALAAANVLLGWTLIGWALCLVWALMVSEKSRPQA